MVCMDGYLFDLFDLFFHFSFIFIYLFIFCAVLCLRKYCFSCALNDQKTVMLSVTNTETC